MKLKATDRCKHCGDEFANHDYVKDSISTYKCPHPRVESGYGFFHGGDPRKFFPDRESCSPKEISNHERACAIWNECEAKGETPVPEKCPSGWLYNDKGQAVAHVLRAPYGIGCYTTETESFFELREHDDDLWGW